MTPMSAPSAFSNAIVSTANPAGRNPYLVVYVDGQLIHDHNDIDDPRVIGFVKQMILISSHSEKQTAVPCKTK